MGVTPSRRKQETAVTIDDGPRRESRRIRVMISGPLPPAVGGMSTYCSDYLRSEVPKRFNVVHCRSVLIRRFLTSRGLVRQVLRLLNAVLVVLVWGTTLVQHRPHIAHIHTSSYAGFYLRGLMAALARTAGARTVLHIHGGEFDRFFHQSSPRIQRCIVALINWNHAVIALSKAWRAFFESVGVHRRKLTVIENAVFLPDVTRGEHRGERVSVLFISLFERGKGVFDVISAFRDSSRLRETCRLVLAGPKRGEWEVVAQEVARGGLGDMTTLPGLLIGGAKDVAYRQADVYVLPSYAEGMPIGLLEAMSYGLACVTTPVGAIPSVIAHMENGLLVPPGDAGRLGEAIERLVSEPGLRRRLGHAARNMIAARFNWNRNAEQLVCLYCQLVNGKRMHQPQNMQRG